MSKQYPIAEKFYSVQGEGFWAGTPMKFLRLAGCSVGGPDGDCTTATGFKFKCDTDYKKREFMAVEEVCEWVGGSKHVCFTGGEPFDRDLSELIDGVLGGTRATLHFETSGTTEIPTTLHTREYDKLTRIWITVSPKLNWKLDWLTVASEVKWLISCADHNCYKIIDFLKSLNGLPFEAIPIYLQPVWDDKYEENLRLALDICKKNEKAKISLQTHKWMGVR